MKRKCSSWNKRSKSFNFLLEYNYGSIRGLTSVPNDEKSTIVLDGEDPTAEEFIAWIDRQLEKEKEK